MSEPLRRLMQAMREAGAIPEEAALPPEEGGDRPWYIALVQGFAGWLAGIFLLVFLGVTFSPNEKAMIFLLGVLLLGAAWFIYHSDREAVFLDQFALALSIAGQFAIAWSVIGDDFEGLPMALSLLALQLALWWVMPNRVARTLAAFFATIAWVYTVRLLVQPAAGEELLFGHGRETLRPLWFIALGWPLTWLPLVALAGWLLRREPRWMASSFRERARPLLIGSLLGLSLAGIVAEPFSFFALGLDTLGLPFSWWALFPLLNIALALYALHGAFHLRSSALLGFAILAALVHLSRFYYLYGTTLLAKSVIMFAVGAGLLAAGAWLHRRHGAGMQP